VRIILSRHGNTFAPGEQAVWVGATLDLPLVTKGKEQARAFASYLEKTGVKPAAIYCGPLLRTLEYSRIVVDEMKLSLDPNVDLRLNELDYGEWSGLTSAEISARFGEDSLKGWDLNCRWPSRGNWPRSEAEIFGEVRSFVGDLVRKHRADDTVVVVSSNGRLRFFLNLIEGELQRRIQARNFKVGTGNICEIVCEGGGFRVGFWDRVPG
jgi:broad specificity phosphatase PhoE